MKLSVWLHAALLVALQLPSAAAQAQSTSLEPVELIPAPTRLFLKPGRCSLDPQWGLRVAFEDSSRLGIDLLRGELRRTHGIWLPSTHSARRRLIVLRRSPALSGVHPLLAAQGYQLSVSADSIVVSAPHTTGIYYGVQTLRQLFRQFSHRALPSLTIVDYPALRLRGISDDISRGQCSTIDDFVAIIEKLGYYKINFYCLYLEDMLRYWSAPEVGVGRGALTPSVIPRLRALASKHHVMVVPIYQSLAHQESFLSYERFASIAERPPIPRWLRKASSALHGLLPAVATALRLPNPEDPVIPSTTVAASSTRSRETIQSLLIEFLSNEGYDFVGLGGDEPFELGTGRSRSAVARRGFGAVYGDYLKALAQSVEQGQSRALVYADVILRDSLAMTRIPRSVGVIDWNYDPRLPSSIGHLRKMGFSTVIASPGLWNWNALYPDLSKAIPNIAKEATTALRSGADGLVVASWCDGGAESLRSLNWAGYAYTADAAWNAPRAWQDFAEVFTRQEYGTADAGLRRTVANLGWQDFGSYASSQRLLRRPPVIKLRTRAALERMATLEREASGIRADLAHVMANGGAPEGIKDLDYVASAYQYSARRELALHSIAASGDARLGKAISANAVANLKELRDSCRALARHHRAQWLRHNKINGLGVIEKRFAQQADALDSLANAAAH